MCKSISLFIFFFNDTATTEIYTLSLHDALPISGVGAGDREARPRGSLVHRERLARRIGVKDRVMDHGDPTGDRKSTRLNSSHLVISYAVFCLKKKNTTNLSYCKKHHT